MNILCASDKVIIPVEASPWGMFGLANMFEFLNEVPVVEYKKSSRSAKEYTELAEEVMNRVSR